MCQSRNEVPLDLFSQPRNGLGAAERRPKDLFRRQLTRQRHNPAQQARVLHEPEARARKGRTAGAPDGPHKIGVAASKRERQKAAQGQADNVGFLLPNMRHDQPDQPIDGVVKRERHVLGPRMGRQVDQKQIVVGRRMCRNARKLEVAGLGAVEENNGLWR
jgi:hypothetical protein